MMRIAILTPVFQDWDALRQLVAELDEIITSVRELRQIEFEFLGVDDGSTVPMDAEVFEGLELKSFRNIQCLRLVANMGHQRAIALGAAHIIKQGAVDAVIVMDADGEDMPSDVPRLVQAALKNPDKVILAQRARRSESFGFRLGYRIYRWLIRLLTGQDLPFGNFSLIPVSILRRLVSTSDIWNHFAAAIGRAKLPLVMVPTDRGKRYSGTSHMNWVSLSIHGLSAISVFSDRVAVRLIIASLLIFAVNVMAMIAVVAIRLFTEMAIPGWASQVFGTLMLASLLSVGFAALLAFVTLHSRHAVSFIPVVDGDKFVHEVQKWPRDRLNTT